MNPDSAQKLFHQATGLNRTLTPMPESQTMMVTGSDDGNVMLLRDGS